MTVQWPDGERSDPARVDANGLATFTRGRGAGVPWTLPDR
jgi:hypothetical protein